MTTSPHRQKKPNFFLHEEVIRKVGIQVKGMIVSNEVLFKSDNKSFHAYTKICFVWWGTNTRCEPAHPNQPPTQKKWVRRRKGRKKQKGTTAQCTVLYCE